MYNANKGKELPTQKELKELFDYAAGNLIRKKGVSGGGKKGTIAGGIHTCNPYRQEIVVGIKGTSYKLSRLVYVWHYGELDGGLMIDHVDGDTMNNRIENLSPITNEDNVRKGKATDQTIYNFTHVDGRVYSGRRADFVDFDERMPTEKVKVLFRKDVKTVPSIFGWTLDSWKANG